MIHNNNCLDILKTLPSASVDLIVTDPPYGINYKSNMQNYDNHGDNITIKKNRELYFDSIKNDKELPVDWIVEAFRVLKEGSAIYIFSHWRTWGELSDKVENVGFNIKNMIVMNKSNGGMGDLSGSWRPKHELLLFASKGRHTLNFYTGKRECDIWDVKVKFSGSKRYHPNEKPIDWIVPCILSSSKVGDTVLDPFAGSGTTGEAAIRTGRKYILIELDNIHYNTMVKRLNYIEKKENCDLFAV